MSSNIVIDKLTFTPTKVTLEFRDDELDPFPKKASVKKLTGNLESHIDAIAEHIVQDLRERYEEDKRQMPLGFNDGDDEQEESTEEEEAETEGQDKYEGFPPPEFDEPEETFHPSQIEVHYYEGTEIPDFTRIEDKHLEKFLQYRYAGEPGGYDKMDLIGDIKYGFDKKIPSNLGTKSVVQAALKIVRGEV